MCMCVGRYFVIIIVKHDVPFICDIEYFNMYMACIIYYIIIIPIYLRYDHRIYNSNNIIVRSIFTRFLKRT